jgi:hypothetical protein
MLARIAGIPVEETALSFGTVAAVVGGFVGVRIMHGISEYLRRRHRSPHLVGSIR